MRRAALVIGYGDSDLRAKITSDWSVGGEFESVEGGDRSDGRASQSRPGDRTTTAKTAPPPMRPSRSWEHGNCLSMTPADLTFDIVIDKGDLDCIVCSSDQINRRRICTGT